MDHRLSDTDDGQNKTKKDVYWSSDCCNYFDRKNFGLRKTKQTNNIKSGITKDSGEKSCEQTERGKMATMTLVENPNFTYLFSESNPLRLWKHTHITRSKSVNGTFARHMLPKTSASDLTQDIKALPVAITATLKGLLVWC